MSIITTREQTPRVASYARPAPQRARAGDSSLTMRDIAKILRRRKWLILLMLAGFTVLSCVVTWLWARYAPLYTAAAYIQVMVPKEAFLNPGAAPAEGILERQKRGYVSVAKSATILRRALTDEVLGRDLRSTEWYKRYWTSDLDGLVRQLQEEVAVASMAESNLISISMSLPGASSDQRKQLPTIVNAVARTFLAYANQTVTEERNRTIAVLNAQRDTVTSQLTLKRREIASRVSSSQVPAMRDRADTLSMEVQALITHILELQRQQSRYDAAMQSFKDQLQSGAIMDLDTIRLAKDNDPMYRNLQVALTDTEARYEAQVDRFGPEHRTVKTLLTERDVIKKRLQEREAELNKSSLVAMQAGLDSAQKSVASELADMQDRYNQKTSAWRELDTALTDIERMETEARQLTERLQELDNKLTDLELLKGDPGSMPVSPAADATIPLEPSWPRWGVMVPLGAVVGLIFGVSLALLLELVDTSVKTPTDIARRVDLPLLAMVPHSDDLEEEIDDFRAASLLAGGPLVGEAYRDLRTNLLFSGPAEQRRTLLITSPSPGDGRTSVAVGLAVAMAHSGRRVLLVDVNFRRPAMSDLFSVPGEPGFSDALSAQCSWQQCVHQTAVANLSVMAAGKLPPNPNELLGSPLCQAILSEMAGEYEQVILDGPPLLLISDASVVATLTDGVIVVVRAGVNTYGIVQRCRDGLNRLGAHMVGVVLNGVRTTAGGYLRHHYQRFYDYQNPSEDGRPPTEPTPPAPEILPVDTAAAVAALEQAGADAARPDDTDSQDDGDGNAPPAGKTT